MTKNFPYHRFVTQNLEISEALWTQETMAIQVTIFNSLRKDDQAIEIRSPEDKSRNTLVLDTGMGLCRQ